MKKSGFTETQIFAVLKEVDAGKPVKELCRQHGISDVTDYNYSAKNVPKPRKYLMRVRNIPFLIAPYPPDIAQSAMMRRRKQITSSGWCRDV